MSDPQFLIADIKGEPAVRHAATTWYSWLAHERRLSPHTIDGYVRDVVAFMDFMDDHLGFQPGIRDLSTLRSTDYRRYLAVLTERGLTATSRARAISALKSFFGYMERHDLASNPAIAAMRSPKLPHSVPKALDVDEVLEAISSVADLTIDPWVGKRDQAILMLLYGCGLRISEALGLNRSDLPRDGVIRVRGKGNKERLVPVLPVVSDTISSYIAACPIEAGADDCDSDDSGHVLICDPTAFSDVRDALEAALGEPERAALTWRPQNTIDVDVDKASTMLKLIDALEDNDDVQKVASNFEVSDEVMAQLSAE